jgi:AraC family transcriptional regulator
MSYPDPEIRHLQDRSVACVSNTGNYVGDTELFARLFTELGEWASAMNLLTPDTVFLSAYENDPRTTPLDQLKLDVCMSIPDGVDVVSDKVRHKILPGGNFAVMHAELAGADEYASAWNAIVEWAEKNGYPTDPSRPSYEIYLNDPEEHPQKHQILDICLSVHVYA